MKHLAKAIFMSFALPLLTSPLAAQTVLSGDHSVDGALCAGDGCNDAEDFDNYNFKINNQTTSIVGIFFDQNVDIGSFARRDWAIRANESFIEKFMIKDIDANFDVLAIEGDARANALYIDSDGEVGFGTSLPQSDLHIITEFDPQIRLEQSSGTPYAWELGANSVNFFVEDVTGGTFPLVIDAAAPEGSFHIQTNGDVGLGTSDPSAPLELSRDETFNFFRITATGAAVNESVDITFTGGPLGTGQLRYNIVDGDNQEMSLDADGNMVLDGTLTTTGPTCAGGCDRVFDDDFALASIEDHASSMWQNGHLPAVGPTAPGSPVNLTDRMGDMLNELEHAHIYIEQLNETLARNTDIQTRMLEEIATLRATQDALVERLAALDAE